MAFFLPALGGGMLVGATLLTGEGTWPGILLRLVLLMAGCAGVGLWVLELGPDLSPLERIAAALGVGYGVLGLLWFILGLTGHLSRTAVAVVLAIAVVAGGPAVWAWLRSLTRGGGPGAFPLSALVGCGLVGVALLLAAAGALRPPSTEEALSCTAAIPEQWVLEGRMTAQPSLSATFAPPAAMLHHAAALALGGEELAGLWGALPGILLLLAAALMTRWIAGGAWAGALLAAALIGAVPLLGSAAASPGGVVPGAGLGLLSLWALLRGSGEPGARWGVLSGLLLGFSLSASFGGWIFVPAIFVLGIVHREAGEKLQDALHRLGIVTATAVVVVLPAALRAWILTGNPVYPHLWGGAFWDDLSASLLSESVAEIPGPLALWLGQVGETAVLGPAVPLLVAAALISPILGDRAISMGVAAGILGLGWAVGSSGLGWLLPVLTVVCALAAAVSSRLRRRRPLLGKLILLVLLLPSIGGVAALAEGLRVRSLGLFPERAELLRESFPRAADYERLRAILPEDAVVLLVGETRPYGLGRRALWGTHFDTAPLTRFVREARRLYPDEPEATVRDVLLDARVTHILQDEPGSRRLDQEYDHFRELRGGRWGSYLGGPIRPKLLWADARGTLLFDVRGAVIEELGEGDQVPAQTPGP
jgi:hypothetical protein